MTEEEWLTCENPHPLLEYLRGKGTDRKLRLLLCAIGRSMPDGYVREEEAAALQVSERYADGEVSNDELNAFRNKQKRSWIRGSPTPVSMSWSSLLVCSRKLLMQSCFELCARTLRSRIVELTDEPAWERSRQLRHSLLGRERPRFLTIIHCIFGNPFRPVTILPEWRTPTVVSLATGIYEERAFDRMPILADALMDASCDNETILTHCRGPGPHTRGCWVLDLLTNRE
jgi:hypothetical protein